MGAASQTEGLSRVGAQMVASSDWFRFKLAVARAGLRDGAGFELTDGESFSQGALGIAAIVPVSDPLPIAPSVQLIPALVFQGNADVTTEFDANAPNRLAAEGGVALRVDLGAWAFLRIATTVEYELTGLISELGRDDTIGGRHALELAFSLPDREELDRAQIFVGIAAETPYSSPEKSTAAYFTLGVMYGEVFGTDDESLIYDGEDDYE
ncbi:MAG: hypothetical protein AAFY60_14260 [Myxococcota bacterium]